mgnify:FL=1
MLRPFLPCVRPGQTSAVRGFHGMRIDEARGPSAGDHLHAGLAEMGRERLIPPHLIHNAGHSPERCGKVDLRLSGERNAVGAGLSCVTDQSGSLGQNPSGDAAVVGAGSPEVSLFEEGDLRTELPSP